MSKFRSFTRQGALAKARRRREKVLAKAPLGRLRMTAYLAAGSVLIGLGVSFLLHADLGLPPYDVMLSAVRIHTDLTHGQASWIAAAVLFTIAALLGRPPKPAGLFLSFVNGFSVDVFTKLLVDPDPMALRVLFSGLGIVSITAGIALVIYSGTTGGAFDLLMQAGGDRGIREVRVRVGLEVGVIVAGVLAGGTAGAATVLFALVVGPLLKTMTQALLDHREGRTQRLTAEALAAGVTSSTLDVPDVTTAGLSPAT